jgi:hypothetical protein
MGDSREVLHVVDQELRTVQVQTGGSVAEQEMPALLSAVPSVVFRGLRQAFDGGFVPGGPDRMFDVKQVAVNTGNQQ